MEATIDPSRVESSTAGFFTDQIFSTTETSNALLALLSGIAKSSSPVLTSRSGLHVQSRYRIRVSGSKQ